MWALCIILTDNYLGDLPWIQVKACDYQMVTTTFWSLPMQLTFRYYQRQWKYEAAAAFRTELKCNEVLMLLSSAARSTQTRWKVWVRLQQVKWVQLISCKKFFTLYLESSHLVKLQFVFTCGCNKNIKSCWSQNCVWDCMQSSAYPVSQHCTLILFTHNLLFQET